MTSGDVFQYLLFVRRYVTNLCRVSHSSVSREDPQTVATLAHATESIISTVSVIPVVSASKEIVDSYLTFVPEPLAHDRC
jgi:hypothetical protein